MTPAIRNWWAERSVTALGQRIIALERELEEVEKQPVISDGEERILRALTWLGFILTQLIGLFAFTLGMALQYKIKGEVEERYVKVGLVLLMIVIWGVQASITAPTIDFLKKRSRTYREKVAKEIEELKARLAGRA